MLASNNPFSPLNQVTDWGLLAEGARYKASLLAKLTQVSLRTLDRFFDAQFGRSPQFWLDELRLIKSALLLANGNSAKSIAYALGFYDAAHFTREFKRYYGCTPTRFVRNRQVWVAARTKELESCFPGQAIPPEWLADSSLIRAEELLLQLPERRRLNLDTKPLG